MDMPLLFMQKNQKRLRKTGRRNSAGTVVRNWSNLIREGRKSSVMRTAGGNGGNFILKKLIGNRMLSIREFFSYGNKGRRYCSHACYIHDRFWREEEGREAYTGPNTQAG